MDVYKVMVSVNKNQLKDPNPNAVYDVDLVGYYNGSDVNPVVVALPQNFVPISGGIESNTALRSDSIRQGYRVKLQNTINGKYLAQDAQDSTNFITFEPEEETDATILAGQKVTVTFAKAMINSDKDSLVLDSAIYKANITTTSHPNAEAAKSISSESDEDANVVTFNIPTATTGNVTLKLPAGLYHDVFGNKLEEISVTYDVDGVPLAAIGLAGTSKPEASSAWSIIDEGPDSALVNDSMYFLVVLAEDQTIGALTANAFEALPTGFVIDSIGAVDGDDNADGAYDTFVVRVIPKVLVPASGSGAGAIAKQVYQTENPVQITLTPKSTAGIAFPKATEGETQLASETY